MTTLGLKCNFQRIGHRMGLACVMIGLVNREEWGRQVEMPTARMNMMMTMLVVAILVGYLLALGTELFVLYR